MLVDALLFRAESKTFLLSSMEDQFINQLIQNIIIVSGQLFYVKLLDALVIGELSSGVLFVANLAHDWHLWAVSLDMVVELSPSHVLEFFSVANVAPEFRARVLSVHLQLSKGLPDNFSLAGVQVASMWKLTEIDTIL